MNECELRIGAVLFLFLYAQLLAQYVEHSRLSTNVGQMNKNATSVLGNRAAEDM